jgi:DNA ligase-1
MDQLAETCGLVAQTNSRKRKTGYVAGYLRQLDDEDLARAVRFLCGLPLADTEARLSVGYSKLREAVLAASGWDLETLRICYREVGDAGETIGLLLEGKTADSPMPLAEADRLYRELHRSKPAQKVALLTKIFSTYRPLTIQYFVKVITGNLRIGLQQRMVEEAVAAAMGLEHTQVREASNRSGDLARVALAARRGELDQVEVSLFHPMDFMLAKPLDETGNLDDAAQWFVEDKYDGIRAQIHTSGSCVRIFTRGLEDVTSSYPELTAAIRFLPQSLILDGEILAWRDGRALNFTVLQQRLARKKLTDVYLREIPVVFMAYDLLYRNGELLLARTLEQRRALLEETLTGRPAPLLLSPQQRLTSLDALDQRFAEARERGNEGLLLKRAGSFYEPGRRSGQWVKVKRPYATLDVVITAAEQGHGRRATMLSDYTFAVRSGGRYLNIGKAYSGLTDDEIRELTRLLRASATERYGRVTLVRPEVVLEVAFDGIQKSPRHKSGFALRFPRILRWRKDKRPEQVDDLERVARLYESSLV